MVCCLFLAATFFWALHAMWFRENNNWGSKGPGGILLFSQLEHLSTNTVLVGKELGRADTFHETVSPTKSRDHLIMQSFERSHHQLKSLYLLYHKTYVHQMWQDGNLLEGLLSIKSHDPFIKWPCEITWQTENISLQQWLWPLNQIGYIQWGAFFNRVTLQGHMIN